MTLEEILVGKEVVLGSSEHNTGTIVSVVQRENISKSLVDTSVGFVCGLWYIMKRNSWVKELILYEGYIIEEVNSEWN